jgi:hypothetical protein
MKKSNLAGFVNNRAANAYSSFRQASLAGISAVFRRL